MKKFSICALFLTGSTVYSQEEGCLDKHLTFQADYGYIRRQDVRDLRLVEDTSILINENGSLEPKKVMDTDNLVDRLDWEPAFRALVEVDFTPCYSLEAQFTYFSPWTAKSVVTGTALQFPFIQPTLTVNYTDANKVVARYKSELRNAELNFWTHMTPQRVNYFSFAWNLGARGMDLYERMTLHFFQNTEKSFYKIHTRDHLYGLQLGAMLEVNPTCYWTWTFIIKGAGFFNSVRNDVDVRDQNNSVTIIDYKKKHLTDSWLLEAYGQLAFNLGSFLSIHVGYQGFILTGIGLAANNRTVHLPERASVNYKGQIIIDGIYGGLNFSF